MRISGVPVRKKMGPSQLSAESEKDKGLQLERWGRETERKLFFLLLVTLGAREESGGN